MADLLERLTPEYVAAHPFTLLEAIEHIQMLRADLERANRWIGVIEGSMIAQINAKNEH